MVSMTALQRIQQIAAGILKYGALASAAVTQVQTEVGASAGDPTIQKSKQALAVTYVLAAAHAGENVPNTTVQLISGVVDLVAGIFKALGLGGKTASTTGTTVVPGVAPKP